MADKLGPSVRKVQAAFEQIGQSHELFEMSQSTRTAAEAAAAVGCRVDQIVKSLIFRGTATNRSILVVASGANRVNEARIGELLGEPIEKGNAAFVREKTGFVIGGVPP